MVVDESNARFGSGAMRVRDRAQGQVRGEEFFMIFRLQKC